MTIPADLRDEVVEILEAAIGRIERSSTMRSLDLYSVGQGIKMAREGIRRLRSAQPIAEGEGPRSTTTDELADLSARVSEWEDGGKG